MALIFSGFISLVPTLRYWAINKGAQGIMGQEYLIYTYYKMSLFSLLLVISPFTQANLHIYMPLQLLVPCLYFESLSNWYTYLYYNNYMYKNWGKRIPPFIFDWCCVWSNNLAWSAPFHAVIWLKYCQYCAKHQLINQFPSLLLPNILYRKCRLYFVNMYIWSNVCNMRFQ